jgi:hypothetical protein
MGAIKMSVAEMKLQHAVEENNFNRTALDIKTSQKHQIMAMFEEHEQRLEDTYNTAPDYVIKSAAYFKLQELRDLRNEIETIQEQEG